MVYFAITLAIIAVMAAWLYPGNKVRCYRCGKWGDRRVLHVIWKPSADGIQEVTRFECVKCGFVFTRQEEVN